MRSCFSLRLRWFSRCEENLSFLFHRYSRQGFFLGQRHISVTSPPIPPPPRSKGKPPHPWKAQEIQSLLAGDTPFLRFPPRTIERTSKIRHFLCQVCPCARLPGIFGLFSLRPPPPSKLSCHLFPKQGIVSLFRLFLSNHSLSVCPLECAGYLLVKTGGRSALSRAITFSSFSQIDPAIPPGHPSAVFGALFFSPLGRPLPPPFVMVIC